MSANTTTRSTTTFETRGDPQYLGAGAIAAIIISCILLVGIVIGICCVCGRRYNWWKRFQAWLKGETGSTTTSKPDSPIPLTPLPPSPAVPGAPPSAPQAVSSPICTRQICKHYSMHHLKLHAAYFAPRHNKCYCASCYAPSQPDRITVAGSTYTAPLGWMRFGLKVDPAMADPPQIFQKWYTTFYGTSEDKVESILSNRQIPFPGDHLASGQIFQTHLRDKTHVYTSPSIYYASLQHICPKDTAQVNGVWYDFQVVLECKQNPHGIIKRKGYRQTENTIIPNGEIEWKTRQRSSLVPYGLLIRAQKHQCIKQCQKLHA